MLPLDIFLSAMANGLMMGAVYALVALGLTLVYGVLHIINFAHGATLTAAMYAVYVAHAALGVDPYLALPGLAAIFFALGYLVQRWVIGPASHGDDSNILLVTLGLSIIMENALLAGFRSDTRSIDVPYGFSVVEVGNLFLSTPKLVAFAGSFVVAALLWLLLARTDTGRAIRAVAKEKTGAALVGVRPTFLVNPRIGNAFVLVAFTIVVLGGMGSIPGALIGGLFVGVVESLSGLYLGESLGQIGIFLIFILVLLARPTGLFGARA